MAFRKTAHFKLDSVASLLLFIVFIVGMFFLLRGIFIVLTWIAPILLIAALILDKSVVINYVKWLGSLVKSNPWVGVAAILLSLVGYMGVFPYLFIKALFNKKIKDAQRKYERQEQGELIDFEEIDSQPNSDLLDLPQIKKNEEGQERDKYNQLFD